MARLLEIREICERALRRIGAYAIRSSGARPEEIEETRFWLDMVVGHVAARRRAWWLVPVTGTFPLLPGQAHYNLTDKLGAQAPDGVQFAISAYLHDVATGRELHEVSLVRRQDYEAIEDKARQGEPEVAYIDRNNRPSLTIHPVPDAHRQYSLRLVFQSFGSDMTRTASIDKSYAIRRSWNLYLVTATAAQIANGPVRKLPADEVKDMKEEAEKLLFDLETYDGDEQANEPQRTDYNDGI